MRVVFVVALCLAAGCSRPRPIPGDVEAAPEPEAIRLYADAEIKKLTRIDLDKEAGPDKYILEIPCLDVVPSGESRPRGEVFKALRIEEARIGDFRESARNHVVFLTWRVSPSYDISCMTAVNDRENMGLKMTDPKRKVYGIRLVKRSGRLE